jgi:hypothetical protein
MTEHDPAIHRLRKIWDVDARNMRGLISSIRPQKPKYFSRSASS